MVMAESPVEGNSGGQPQIEDFSLVVALLAVIKYPGKKHHPVLLC